MSSAARIWVSEAGSWLRTSFRTWETSSLSVAPGSISDERTWRAVSSWRKASLKVSDSVLGQLVDAPAGADASPRNRADIHQVRDAARFALGRAQSAALGR
jgi:hypothetical protein